MKKTLSPTFTIRSSCEPGSIDAASSLELDPLEDTSEDEDVDPDPGKISPGSPIGKALMGKQKGDEVIVSLPERKIEYEVIRVNTIQDKSKDDKA